MAHDPAVADLESFLAERGEPLLRTAVLLTGSKEAGEDLLQAGLERHRSDRWRSRGLPAPDAVNLAADGWRRQRAWRRLPLLQTETAMVLGCTAGSVKASASRGLQRLRELSGTSTENDLAEEKTR